MSGFGFQDIANLGGRLPGMGQGRPDAGDGADSFGDLFKKTSGAAGNGQAAASTESSRRSMADPERWAASHGAPAGNPGAKSAAAQQLSDYLSMPLSKRMFYMMLASMGISQEQYDAMSPEEQAKVAAQVAQRLKDGAEAQKQASQDKAAVTAQV